MFNQKSVKWSFLIASVLILAACGEVGPSPSLSSSSASSSTPNSISQSSSSSSSSQPPVQYTITFKNYDDSVLSTQTVNQGSTVVYSGPTPTRPSTSQYTYTFTGWDKNLTNVTSSFSTIAQYSSTINSYTITWKNHDGTVLETDNNVPYGTTPTYNGSTATQTSNADYDFTFNGWSPEVVSVEGNAIYIAQFTQNLNYIPITTAQELNNIRNNLSGSYRLMNDIDLESNEWVPIGSGSTPFSGTLDGKEFTISNLTITQTQEYVGLFANNSGTIRNLKLENVQINVQGSLSSFIYAGSLVANNTGIIENIETISGSLFARARGGNIGYVGGLIGVHNRNITLDNLVNNANVNGENTTNMGGLIGRTNSITIINNSMNTGTISGLSNVGGLVGWGNSTITITNTRNNGSVTGTSFQVGGLIGRGNEIAITITNSMNSGSVNGFGMVGGLIGLGWAFTNITNSINSGSVSGTEDVGGFIGLNGGTIINSYNFGNISGTERVGGFIGNGKGIITTSINNGNIVGIGGFGYVGGLIGKGSENNINNSINKGNVSWSGDSRSGYVGGLIGRGDGQEEVIIDSLNKGNVSGFTRVGGLVGWVNGKVKITTSMNIGNVNGSSQVGGLIGKANSQLFVYYSVNLGNVIVSNISTAVGGITGDIPTTNDLEEVYHSGSITSNGVEVAGTNFGSKVTDISTFNIAFFTTTLEWDTDIWDFTGLDIANGVYPTLKNMPEIPLED
jgi:hypothetical protein